MPVLPDPPRFDQLSAYGDRLGDVGFWAPYVRAVLSRHDFADRELEAGFVGTYPTFLAGDVVVKLFGCFPSWQTDSAAELAAQQLLHGEPGIPAPRLLSYGNLYSGTTTWPYLITSRLSGVAWRDADLSYDRKLALAAELGPIIRRVHAVAVEPSALVRDFAADHRAEAAARQRNWGALPAHLIDQIDAYVRETLCEQSRFIHADLTEDHLFVDAAGSLVGIIDWGDAMVTDRHYELGALHFGMFDGDQRLLRAFLESYGWPVGDDFARRALTFALLHQFDVLGGAVARLPVAEIASLEELADALFSRSG